MDKILHDLKDSKLWELWYIPYNGSCRILCINSITSLQGTQGDMQKIQRYRVLGFIVLHCPTSKPVSFCSWTVSVGIVSLLLA